MNTWQRFLKSLSHGAKLLGFCWGHCGVFSMASGAIFTLLAVPVAHTLPHYHDCLANPKVHPDDIDPPNPQAGDVVMSQLGVLERRWYENVMPRPQIRSFGFFYDGSYLSDGDIYRSVCQAAVAKPFFDLQVDHQDKMLVAGFLPVGDGKGGWGSPTPLVRQSLSCRWKAPADERLVPSVITLVLEGNWSTEGLEANQRERLCAQMVAVLDKNIDDLRKERAKDPKAWISTWTKPDVSSDFPF